jgi:RNA polymerase sigma-70 factor (ECF subfamily)
LAFGALVKAYGGVVTRVIGRLVSDPDDREDLVQETFVRAFTALDKFKLGAPFRPWLLTIALNLARDAWRRRKTHREVVPLVDEAGAEMVIPSLDPAPDAVSEGEELRARAEAAFRRLDEDHQAILWLRVREGLEYAEIATVLGIPRGTVMSRLARARAALKVELEGSGDHSRRNEDPVG